MRAVPGGLEPKGTTMPGETQATRGRNPRTVPGDAEGVGHVLTFLAPGGRLSKGYDVPPRGIGVGFLEQPTSKVDPRLFNKMI